MRVFVIFVYLLFCPGTPIKAQIGEKVNPQNSIQGTWENNEFGFHLVLVFQPDGRGSFDGELLTYQVNNNSISITQSGEVNHYTFYLDGNTLGLSGGDLEQKIVFTRASSITSVSPQDDPDTEMNNVLSENTSNGDIVGIWSAPGETIEFQQNGHCIYLNQTYPYRISPGNVTLTTSTGDITFSYVIAGDQLTLSFNQNSVSYTKSSGSPGSSTPVQNTGEGLIDQSIVGKWCYVDVNSYDNGGSSSSTCITLNANGTYEYHGESSRSVNTSDFWAGTNNQQSDQGTWYVKGDRIYYNSAVNGQGSYRLEKRNHPKNVNDPMIVLDGAAYTTFYSKPPWK